MNLLEKVLGKVKRKFDRELSDNATKAELMAQGKPHEKADIRAVHKAGAHWVKKAGLKEAHTPLKTHIGPENPTAAGMAPPPEKQTHYMTREQAHHGAGIAEQLHAHTRNWEESGRQVQSLTNAKQAGKKFVPKDHWPAPVGKVRIDDALKAASLTHKDHEARMHGARAEYENFHKKHGIEPVHAWQALNGRRWPYYRVDSGGGKDEPHYAIKEDLDETAKEPVDTIGAARQYGFHAQEVARHSNSKGWYGGVSGTEFYDRTWKKQLAHHKREMAKYAKLMKEETMNESVVKPKVGDKVIPKLGPHANTPHEVIHVHDDGSFNIRPLLARGQKIKYHLGAARATGDQVNKMNEENHGASFEHDSGWKNTATGKPVKGSHGASFKHDSGWKKAEKSLDTMHKDRAAWRASVDKQNMADAEKSMKTIKATSKRLRGEGVELDEAAKTPHEVMRTKLGFPKNPPKDVWGGRHGPTESSWRKSGGYAGEKTLKRLRDKAISLGFKKADDNQYGNPDGSVVGSGSNYVHPDGHVLNLDSSYGVVKSENRFRANLKHVTKNESVELEEGKMGQISADIGDHLDKHIAEYKKNGGAEALASHVTKAHAAIAKMHGLKPEHAKKFVNDYVDSHLKESIEEQSSQESALRHEQEAKGVSLANKTLSKIPTMASAHKKAVDSSWLKMEKSSNWNAAKRRGANKSA